MGVEGFRQAVPASVLSGYPWATTADNASRCDIHKQKVFAYRSNCYSILPGGATGRADRADSACHTRSTLCNMLRLCSITKCCCVLGTKPKGMWRCRTTAYMKQPPQCWHQRLSFLDSYCNSIRARMRHNTCAFGGVLFTSTQVR